MINIGVETGEIWAFLLLNWRERIDLWAMFKLSLEAAMHPSDKHLTPANKQIYEERQHKNCFMRLTGWCKQAIEITEPTVQILCLVLENLHSLALIKDKFSTQICHSAYKNLQSSVMACLTIKKYSLLSQLVLLKWHRSHPNQMRGKMFLTSELNCCYGYYSQSHRSRCQ